ncbi:MAG: SurA N-terminal domain-containing protein [Hyphomonadaceae bacterium]|nr:SurA N-terminal domain-containing protein [Hyphomonadaceae bacterium]
MLAQMRTLTRGWIARIILGVIAIMMVVTLFSSDFLQGIQGVMNPNQVATVAGQSISPAELNRDFENWMQSQKSRERPVSRADAIQQGVPQRVLEGIIGRRALYAFAQRLGIEADDTQVAEEIRKIQAVQNPLSGTFDRQEYLNFLSQIKYTPAEFEREVRRDLSVQQLLAALTDGARAPSAFGKLAFAYETERRLVSIAEISPGAAGAIPAPTDAQLQELYLAMRSNLQIPEYRQLTLVFARPSDFIPRVTVPEDRVREEFNARRARFEQPEKRSFVQISSPDEAKARDAAARLGRGEDPAAVASALALQIVSYDQQTQGQIPDNAVARAAFGMAANAAQAVRGALTPWAAVRITAITPAVSANFDAHRQEIHEELARDEAIEMMNAAVDSFNDARAAGGSLAQAARANNLSVAEVARVDAQGRDANGQPVEALLDQPELIRAAFEAPEGEATDFIASSDGADVIIQVNRVIPQSVRPLAEVRNDIAQLWVARERARKLEEIAHRIEEGVAAGQTFATASAAAGAQMVVRSQELNREIAARGLPSPQLGGAIYGAREGQVVHAPRPDNGALIVAIVEEIRRGDPAAAGPQIEALRRQFDQAIGQSLALVVEDAAIQSAKPKRNERLMAQIFSTTPQSEDQ